MHAQTIKLKNELNRNIPGLKLEDLSTTYTTSSVDDKNKVNNNKIENITSEESESFLSADDSSDYRFDNITVPIRHSMVYSEKVYEYSEEYIFQDQPPRTDDLQLHPKSCVLWEEYEKLLERARELEGYIRKIRLEVKRIVCERQILVDQINLYSNRIESLKETKNHAESLLERNTELEEKMSKIHLSYENDINTNKQVNETLKKKLEKYITDNNNLKEESLNYNNKLEDLLSLVKTLENERDKLKNSDKLYKKLNIEFNKINEINVTQARAFQHEIDQLKEQIKFLTKQLNDKKKEITESQKLCRNSEIFMTRNKYLENLVGEMQTDFNEKEVNLREGFVKIESQYLSKTKEVQELRECIKNDNKMIQNLNNKLNEKKHDLEKWNLEKNNFFNLQEDLNNLKKFFDLQKQEWEEERQSFILLIDKQRNEFELLSGINDKETLIKKIETLEKMLHSLQMEKEYIITDMEVKLNHETQKSKESNDLYEKSQLVIESLKNQLDDLNNFNKTELDRFNKILDEKEKFFLNFKEKIQILEENEKKLLLEIENVKAENPKEPGFNEHMKGTEESIKKLQKIFELNKPEMQKNFYIELKNLQTIKEEEINIILKNHKFEIQKKEISLKNEIEKIRKQHSIELQSLNEVTKIQIHNKDLEIEQIKEKSENREKEIESNSILNSQIEIQKLKNKIDEEARAEIRKIFRSFHNEILKLQNEHRRDLEKINEINVRTLEELKKRKQKEIKNNKDIMLYEHNTTKENLEVQLLVVKSNLNDMNIKYNNMEEKYNNLIYIKKKYEHLKDNTLNIEELLKQERKRYSKHIDLKNKELLFYDNKINNTDLLNKYREYEKETKHILSEYQKKIEKHNSKIDNLMLDKQNLQHEINKYINLNKNLENKINELNEDVKIKNDTISDLTKKNIKYNELSDEFFILQSQYEQLKLQNNDLIITNETRHKQLDLFLRNNEESIIKKNEDLQNKVDSLLLEIENFRSRDNEYVNQQKENELKTKKIEKLEKDLRKKDSLIDEFNNEIYKLKISLSTKPKDSTNLLEEKIRELTIQKDYLINEQKELKINLNNERDMLLKQLEIKNRQLKTFESTNQYARKLMERNDMLEEMIEKLFSEKNEEIQNIENEMRQQERHHEIRVNDENRYHYCELEFQNSTLKNIISDLKKKLQQKIETESRWNENEDDIELIQLKTERNNENNLGNIQELLQEIEILRKSEDSYRSECNRLKYKYDEHLRECQNYSENLFELKSTVEKLKKKLEKQNNKISHEIKQEKTTRSRIRGKRIKSSIEV